MLQIDHIFLNEYRYLNLCCVFIVYSQDIFDIISFYVNYHVLHDCSENRIS